MKPYNIMNDHLTDDFPLTTEEEVHIILRSETVDDFSEVKHAEEDFGKIIYPPPIRPSSPLPPPPNNSDSSYSSRYDGSETSSLNSEYDDYLHQTPRMKKNMRYKHLTFEEVEKSLNSHVFKNTKFSGEFDMLITFVKGQKHIYNQSNRLVQQRLYSLLIPILFISSTVTVLAPILSNVYMGGWIITIMNSILTILITLSHSLQYSSTQRIFMYYENHYGRLETSLEMTKSQFLLIEDKDIQKEMILTKIKDTENRMMEIKEIFSATVPSVVRTHTPIISNINIFSVFEKVENYKNSLIMNYKDVKNEIRYIMHKWNTDTIVNNGIDDEQKEKERVRLQYLLTQKDVIKNVLINYKHGYTYVDELFTREIKQSRRKLKSFFSYLYFRVVLPEEFNSGNPFLDNYLKFVFSSK
jgi:hypothetical protein